MQINVILKIMSFFYVFVKGIKNMTQTEVIDRIKQANKVSDIFKKYSNPAVFEVGPFSPVTP